MRISWPFRLPKPFLTAGSRHGQGHAIVVEGVKKAGGGAARNRLLMTIGVFVAIYCAISVRLIYLGVLDPDTGSGPVAHVTAARPDIVDRNGELLATDIKTFSLYGEPRRIVDVDEAVEKLQSVLPDLDAEQTYKKLKTNAGFVWLKRLLTPRQENEIMQLGIPGIGFRTENRRFYPGGPVASHILGLTNIDNQGIAGMEKWIDDQGLADLRASGLATRDDLAPVRLSIDLRVQSIVHDELTQGLQKYNATADGAVVLNARTGEVLAMVSLPDYDPNNPFNAHEKSRLNRMTAGTFEMGSTIKSFTTAMAVDVAGATLDSRYDASRPLTVGRQTIHDFHGKGRVLSLAEVFIYSSNIGSAREALSVGIDGHREFLKRLGLLDRMKTELPEVAQPQEPKVWKTVNSITIAFGHGIATTPLQTAVGAAALVNGGYLFDPTFLPRSQAEADANGRVVVKPQTGEVIRYLYRLNAEKGSGRNARVPGYRVGGKTGTAEKIINGRYSKGHNFNAFVAAFPMEDPQYVVLVFVDDPQPATTAGMNTAPMVSNIIRRSAALLGVKPDFGQEANMTLAAYR